MITRPIKPLKPEEIPSKIRSYYNYTSQKRELVGKRGQKHLKIERKCPKCRKIKSIVVYRIRDAIKKQSLTAKCSKCYRKSYKPLLKINPNPNRRINHRGYIRRYYPNHPHATNKYILEHRMVMEKHIGRYLLPTETVHHKNGIKSDNKIENLELRAGRHGTGSKYEDLSDQQIISLISYLKHLLKNRKSCNRTTSVN